MKRETLNVATALNRKYVRYTIVMLTSLCVNNSRHVDAYLLHSELMEEDIRLMKDSMGGYDISIFPIKVDEQLFAAELPRTELWTIETYYRLLLLDVLPASVERILYLDVDIIVNKSLEEFYTVDFGEDDLIACADGCGRFPWEIRKEKQKQMFAPMIEQGYQYFNAGVMLLNIDRMRGKYSFDTYLQAIAAWNCEMDAPDQDILNYVHWRGVGYVDPYQFDLFAKIAHDEHIPCEWVKENTCIIHYSNGKPWNAKDVHFDLEQIWWDYAKQTPFYIEFLEEFLDAVLHDTTVEDRINATTEQLTRAMALNHRLLESL